MLIIVQPVSAGVQLAQRAVAAGYSCLIPTQFPGLLPPGVHAGAQVVSWHPDHGVAGLLRCAEQAKARPSGVIAGFEYAVPETAALAQLLGLPALSQATAAAVRQKDLMRHRCAERGISVPGSVAVPPGQAVDPPFPFPVVVKPVDCGGSLMVRLARDAAEYSLACAEIHQADQVKFHYGPRRVALVEQFVEGPEFSIEGWADPGGVHLASVTTKFVSAPPHFFEMGHIATAPGQSPHGELLASFARQVVAAFDISVGLFHIEARIASDGQPVLIEVGARQAGDFIPELIKAGPDVDLYLAAIDAACGRPHPGRASSPVSAGLAFVTTGQAGAFAGQLSGLEPYRSAPEFSGLSWDAEPGMVVDPDDIFRNRVAQVHFRGELSRVTELVGAVLRDVTPDLMMEGVGR